MESHQHYTGFDFTPSSQGLYDPKYEKDACGVGMIADLSGTPSRSVVEDALQVLENLDHRGARGCEQDTGDGAGLLCGMPDKFMRRMAMEMSVELPPPRQYAVGMVFLDKSLDGIAKGKQILDDLVRASSGLKLLLWRRVPVESECLGKTALAFEPVIMQVFIGAEGELAKDVKGFEAALFVLRKKASNVADSIPGLPFYICSLSSRVINYKGMLTCPGLLRYFDDLVEEDFESHVALVHSRFSTNTFPAWRRAHPFRLLCHNGEINTLRGNVNAMRSREGLMSSDVLGPELKECFPLIEEDQTDSGIFDNVLEVLCLAGRTLPEAITLMMPPAWENNTAMKPELRDYFKYQASIMEPWDGPALMCFTDGDSVGACLDRNGLRPCRYYVTKSNKLILSSEAGVITVNPTDVVKKGRLSPGKMLCGDFSAKRILEDAELKQTLSVANPWAEWVSGGVTMQMLQANPEALTVPRPDEAQRLSLLRSFGFHEEALDLLLLPMAKDGEEALGSMGNDAPLACLSDRSRSVFDYFYQLFAQVTNPPIDPIRESVVMSLGCWVGPEENLLSSPTAAHSHRLWLDSPCLSPLEFAALCGSREKLGWKMHTFDATFPKCEAASGLEAHLGRLCEEVTQAVDAGCQIVVLSDRSICPERVGMPSLLACGAVHHTLVKKKLRAKTALVVDSGEPHEVCHHAMLVTFGADAVCPYMAYEAMVTLQSDGKIPGPEALPEAKLWYNYQKAVNKGLLKIMAKMGISTLRSYKGAQIADAIGLSGDVVEMCFHGIASKLGGLGFEQLALKALSVHERGYPSPGCASVENVFGRLAHEGQYHYRQGEHAEKHINDPMAIAKLQEAAKTNSRVAYASFATIHNNLVKASSIRGQLDFKPPRQYGRVALPIEAVEPASEIVKRFRTGAMSYGSISMEAHSTLAIAMNRLGGFSNTGEGGEDPVRYQQMANGDSMKSAIKQVASGRFGVTMEYLSNAQELQIKMAQGAKPGEGGELPGKKVETHIARTRHSTEGVGLISPPPHHDIYSIEDLAQLIFDLKNANRSAGVSVKLVSEVGVGIVAAGVAKCKADHILISGCDGGTGASKWTGIKHAGAPWEIGLAETHQTLVLNGLRGRVTLETDGQLRTGRDVIIAALLGAERFGFATAPLIAMGCIMMRKCHLNTCPVGVATQDPVLRKKFEGMPEHVVNYLMLVAEEVRVLMAKLGFRSMDELIGHAEVLRPDPSVSGGPFQFSPILTPAHQLPDAGKVGKVEFRKLYDQEHFMVLQRMTDRWMLEQFKMTFRYGEKAVSEKKALQNSDRSIGTLLSHELYTRWQNNLAAATCHARLTGTAGQSFGAFSIKGVFLELEGDAQDYCGKGLCGGMLAIYPPRDAVEAGFKANQNIIIGNTALYGATGGVAFFSGIAAERFAVRNSGAWAVVEGAGDHCCEYMTGGRVAILGSVGDNFAAGMSGGVAWAWDPQGELSKKVLPPSVELSKMDPSKPHQAYPEDIADLERLLETHRDLTHSSLATELLKEWPARAIEFTRVFPKEFMDAVVVGRAEGRNVLSRLSDYLPSDSGTAKFARLRTRSDMSKQLAVAAKSGLDIEEVDVLMKGKRPKKVEDVTLVATTTRGFVELDRADLPKRTVEERVGDFKEILATKDLEKVQTQASRCMDCGTPFCHQNVTERSGCPLGNLIPEWNDLVRKGHWYEAFKRLKKTNNFPEFTGRVCPAPCEGACVLGIIDDPVSIKSVELTIIDKAYEMGWMAPQPPTIRTGKKVAIIGSGPSGLAAADQLNQMGHTVTVYERADRIGGLMMYGVPNMKADKQDVVQRRVDVLRKEGITFFTGKKGHVGGAAGDLGSLGPTATQLLDNNDAVLLSVGSTVARDLSVPGRDSEGIHMAMDYLTGNTKALLDGGNVASGWRRWWGKQSGKDAEGSGSPIDAKGKKVVVIGGGDTGNDCIGTAVRQGATQVINLELLPAPPKSRGAGNPWPHWPMVFRIDYGHEEAAKCLNDGNDIRQYSVSTKEFIRDDKGNVKAMKLVSVKMEGGKINEVPGSEKTIECDLVFLALGFLGPERPLAEMFGVDLDQRGNYKALYSESEMDFATSNPKVFAAGDCRRGQSLVVWAIREGRDAANAVNRYLAAEAPSLAEQA